MPFEEKWVGEQYEIRYTAEEAGEFGLHIWSNEAGGNKRKVRVARPDPSTLDPSTPAMHTHAHVHTHRHSLVTPPVVHASLNTRTCTRTHMCTLIDTHS